MPTDPASREPASTLSETSRLVDIAARRVSILSNGMTVIAQEFPGAPLAAVRAYVRAGSAFEGPWTASGISHLLEHIVSGGGSRGRTGDEIAAAADSIGGLNNAYTGTDHVCYHVNAAPEHLAAAMKLVADWVAWPDLSREAFEREQGVVLRELEGDRDDPAVQLDEMLSEIAYRRHPLAYPVIGHDHRLRVLTHDDLISYHRQTHGPGNVVVGVAANVDLDDMMQCVLAAFEGFEERPLLPCAFPDPPPIVSPIRAARRMKVESASMSLAWLTVREATPDDVPLDLLASVLLDGNSARLVKRLRWERALVYDIGGTHDSAWHSPGLFTISVHADAQQLDAVEREIQSVIDALAVEPITDAELARAKRQAVVGVQLQRQTTEGLAAQLAEDFLATGSVDYSDAYLDRIAAARADDLLVAAKRYLPAHARAIATILPRRGGGRARSRPVRRQLEAADRFSCATSALDKQDGLTCLVRHIAGSPFVAAALTFPGGLRGESEETNGLTNLLVETMQRGTATRSGEQIAEIFASHGSELRADSGLDTIGFEFVALKEDFETLLALLADVVTSPALSAPEVERVKPTILDSISRLDEEWHTDLIRFARDRFFKHSPYRFVGLGTAENVKRFGPADLRAAHTRWISAAGVLSIAGDIDSKRARETIDPLFAALPAKPGRLFDDVPADPPVEADSLFVRASVADRQVASLFVGFPGCTLADRADHVAMTLFGALLVGHTYSGGRLFNALRGGKQDMVYEVSGANLVGLLPGYFGVVAACQPRRINEVYRIVRDQIAALVAGGFESVEFERAREMVATGEMNQFQTPSDFAHRSGYDEVVGLGAEDWNRFLDDLRAIQPGEVTAVAARLLHPATIAVVTPKPQGLDFGLPAVEIPT